MLATRRPLSLSSDNVTYPGYAWEPRTGSCYKFHRAAQPWDAALATCRAEGAQLAVLNSDTESEVLAAIFKKNPSYTITGTDTFFDARDYALVGFADSYGHGTWTTIHGVSLAEAGFEGWASGQPDHMLTGIERCGSIYRNGLLNNVNCFRKFAYICEITP
ncbi:hemolymph lipopolysaccharide-binding protein-like [Cydia amplana]|uniref:hemolymph lipopolysaccharide-binding protein-like n=1 Tax=Cydia amplana TaxID=1869771 RepID=UPI002FE69185